MVLTGPTSQAAVLGCREPVSAVITQLPAADERAAGGCRTAGLAMVAVAVRWYSYRAESDSQD